MSNAIYTSYGWGTRKEGHGHFEGREWTDIQRVKINEYCNNHSIDLKVIDTEHKWMSKILSTIEPDKDIHSKNHSVYTLSAIAALLDFCETDYDLFYWMHLDMAINRMDINIFDSFTIPDDKFYCWAWEEWKMEQDWDRIKFGMVDNLKKATNANAEDGYQYGKCNASVLIANKTCAKKFADTVLNKVNFLDNVPDPSIGFIEETVVEVVESVSDIEVGDSGTFNYTHAKDPECVPINFCPRPFATAYNSDLEFNSVFVHFCCESKFSIPQFYIDRGML